MVTPRVETSPDRSDSAKLGETKQFADDIRSQVAGRELAEMNERLMAAITNPWLMVPAIARNELAARDFVPL